MRRALLVAAAVVAAILGFGAAPAFAQTRVFVSGAGSDANPCSLSAPCRSFQQAHNTVVAGGEIVALDAAGYGPLIISKAVTVTAIGIEASITSNSATGGAIQISAGAGDTVAIRGLTVIAGALANVGIDIKSAKSVTIRDTSISGFPQVGILVESSASLDLELQGVSSNNTTGGPGLDIEPSGNVSALVTESTFNGNGTGVFVSGLDSTGTIKATLNVNAAANSALGILVSSIAGKAQPVVMVTGSKLVNNGAKGLSGSGPVQVFVDRTQISGNFGNGWEATSGAVVNSYKDNEVNGNGSDALNGVTQITSE